MKRKLLLCSILLSLVVGCSKSNLPDEDLGESKNECCKGCMCGDTIELLKNTQTAWTLTNINDKGEYVYDNNSFINFHGTGENKFAFYKNDKNGNTISEIKGEMLINDKDEIVLILNDSKQEKITCKLGEEKNLIALMNCNNEFGTFTLQKEGTIELPSIIKETVIKTKKIELKGTNSRTITKVQEIDVLVSVINNAKVWTGVVTLPAPLYELDLLDSNNKNIAKILYNPDHYFTIEINDRNYELTNIDKELLNTILTK